MATMNKQIFTIAVMLTYPGTLFSIKEDVSGNFFAVLYPENIHLTTANITDETFKQASLIEEEKLKTQKEKIRQEQLVKIKDAWTNELENVGMPVHGYNFYVDYGVEDKIIWESSLAYLTEDLITVEVRAIDNTFHDLPFDVYKKIPFLQEKYYAKQLQKKWRLQKAVSKAQTIEEIKSITWEENKRSDMCC